jgi:hypothetical protein
MENDKTILWKMLKMATCFCELAHETAPVSAVQMTGFIICRATVIAIFASHGILKKNSSEKTLLSNLKCLATFNLPNFNLGDSLEKGFGGLQMPSQPDI